MVDNFPHRRSGQVVGRNTLDLRLNPLYDIRNRTPYLAMALRELSSMSLNHRLEIRIDDERMDLLKEAARRQRKAVGEIIREAIDLHLKEDVVAKRLAAVEALARLDAPVGKPDQMKKEIMEDYYCEPKGVRGRKHPDVRRRGR